eukprot:CAMPEP_0172532488 /NCGR_PEP_ID=MMETSP1067-20121228/5527_1 /TAXON_ID=265564 ORGANISM="Thalassiosira punctigera, Strain Tpunct2005C2" /NCGR_SAMPLE_ID=MMETSP1067 /ASSEMBLY_ACC=CAM_ASM_000444 /LENGTH=457 /DNA_ID=CAMNT_0013317017 /DNA_START=80 /DNA_END=1453 /DNA_ORIENTATION=+
MARKSAFKKIFGKFKSKQKEPAKGKDASTISSVGCGVTGRVNPKLSLVHSAAAEPVPPPPQAPQATAACDDYVVKRSDSATLGTESDHSGSPLAVTKSISSSLKAYSSEDASAAKSKPLPSIPVTSHVQNEADASAADVLPNKDAAGSDENNAGRTIEAEGSYEKNASQEDKVERVKGNDTESDEMASGQESGVGAKKEDSAEKEDKTYGTEMGEKASGEENEVGNKKDKKAWAEEKISQLHSPSSYKLFEKTKIEVGTQINAERRKWIEGLTSPKNETAASNVPDDVKKLGKLSDRMKAVEEALHQKGKDVSSPSVEVSREKAAAQRKAIEDMMKRKGDTKVALESKAKPSPRAISQRKVVEEMLQKQLDPNAFFESKGKTARESLPGTQRLARQKKWVQETLEKQNDPKQFLDQTKERRRTVVDIPNEQKEIFEERKKQIEARAREAKQNALTAR